MKNSGGKKTISDMEGGEIDTSLKDYKYQPKLTEKLEGLSENFTQETINEIVRWKVNRYSELNPETLNLLNQIRMDDKDIDVDLTKDLLRILLDTPGIRLPMASTILRFKNPNIYQIIDQRAYRFLRNEDLKNYFSNIDQQIGIIWHFSQITYQM
ncbi:MAG: hypothetical protein LC127_16940 [Chitinophagales bacterium]|nr:hypothetical protein [Chitinophagales bacterium]